MLVKVLTYLSLAYLSAIAFQSLVFPDNALFQISMVLFALAIFCSLLSRRLLLYAIVGIGLGLGFAHYSSSLDVSAQTMLDVFTAEDEEVTIYGEIISYPVRHESYTSFYLDADALMLHERKLPVSTRILVKTDTYTDYEYGMRVQTIGTLQKPESFLTDTGRVFEYGRFLGKDSVYYVLPYAETQVIEIGPQSLQRRLYTLKKSFLSAMYRMVPSPESGLLAGILFGEKSALGKDLQNDFRTVGLMHIVVLSGYNVSIIIKVFMQLLVFLPRSVRAVLAVCGIAAFALLVGAGPTVIRASIMAVFIVLADVLSREYAVERGLFIAGLIMILMNPKILIFDISFQLSFLATYGLIVLSPWLEKVFVQLPTWFAIRDSAIATIAAQIMVAPLIIYSIGEFSLISPVVNVLVLFAVPIAMGFGFITSVIYFISPVLALPFAMITRWLLTYQLWMVDLFSRWSFADIQFPPFLFVWVIIAYLCIAWGIQKIKKTHYR